MKKNLVAFFIIIFFIFFSVFGKLKAQTTPVGFPVIEDYYRRAQLLGQIDSSISFTSRPFFPKENSKIEDRFEPDNLLKDNRWTNFDGIFKLGKDKVTFKLLPITIFQQYNSDHAAGINDGIMIPAKGYQTLISAGIFFSYGPLSIQLKPEIVYAENRSEDKKTYNGLPYNNQIDSLYRSMYINLIDLPARFGEKPFQKISWGQSSIRLTFGAVSFGFSNENLWWGPGLYNSLLMTNNAPGFKHLTLNTVKPIRTPLGSFEGQIIAGRLEGSGFSPSKQEGWRYLNGVVLSYQPRWVPCLFLGVTRSFQSYSKQMGKSLGDYLPIIIPIGKKAAGGSSEDSRARDQLASVFIRWFWIKGQGEIYFEFGREDHAWNLRDYIIEPTASSAYLIGLRKLIPLNNKKGYIQINMEITQLEVDNITLNRNKGGWYAHYQIIEGHTNQGQILGAGIGPGSNLQTINISWNKGLRSFGIQFERFEHDNDFFNLHVNDIRTNWVDLSLGILSEWNYKNLLFNLKLESIRSKNYKWQYTPFQNTPPAFWNKTHDVMNLHGQLGITYRF